MADVLFDAMGVLFVEGDDTNNLLIPFILRKRPDLSSAVLAELYTQASLGKISSEEFWRRAELPNYPGIEEEYLDGCLRFDEKAKHVLPLLAGRHRLSILSNDVGEWGRRLREKFSLERYFAHSFISGDLGFRKPSVEIYRHALDVLGTPPEQCVFIDDRRKNLLPAHEIGMRTILFSRTPQENPEKFPVVDNWNALLEMIASFF